MIYGLSCRATVDYLDSGLYPEPRLCLLISDCLEDFMASQVANHVFSMSGGKSAVSGQVHILVENSRDINTVSTVIVNIILIVTINHYYQPLFTITTCLTTFFHNLSYSYN